MASFIVPLYNMLFYAVVVQAVYTTTAYLSMPCLLFQYSTFVKLIYVPSKWFKCNNNFVNKTFLLRWYVWKLDLISYKIFWDVCFDLLRLVLFFIKSEVFLVHCMKAYGGNKGTALLILKALDGDEWLTSRSGSFTQVKKLRYPLHCTYVG
jgi:hypothetical protein